MAAAAYGGHKEIVEFFLYIGQNIFTIADYNKAMIEAAISGHIKIVEMMINKGANDYIKAMIQTAGRAYEKNQKAVIEWLIKIVGDKFTIEDYNDIMIEAAENGKK